MPDLKDWQVIAAAKAFMMSADLIRLHQQMGDPLDDRDSRCRGHMDARTRLDMVLPEKQRPSRWRFARPVHVITLEAAPKMDTPGLVRAVCSCGEYEGGSSSPSGAWASGRQHVDARRKNGT